MQFPWYCIQRQQESTHNLYTQEYCEISELAELLLKLWEADQMTWETVQAKPAFIQSFMFNLSLNNINI